ncbi:MAG TPA: hypothetical protein VJ461_01005 [Candidatus Nanoarchaeia archaeon]|nr:hypothetical protein [Candidatus Nanoarchaeia archaeon]
MRTQFIILLLFALFGVFLMRGGITSYAVVENCLAGDCPDTGANLENPATLGLDDSNALSVVGLMLIVISLAMVIGYSKKNKFLSAEGL